jgi:hypothetical protein
MEVMVVRMVPVWGSCDDQKLPLSTKNILLPVFNFFLKILNETFITKSSNPTGIYEKEGKETTTYQSPMKNVFLEQ